MAFDDMEKDVLFIFKVPVYDALCDAEAVSDLRKRRIGEPLFYKKIQRALHYPLSRIFRRFFRPAQKVFLLHRFEIGTRFYAGFSGVNDSTYFYGRLRLLCIWPRYTVEWT